MRLRLAPLALLALVALPARAQVDEPAPLVVMNLAAHPDDEDGLTMAYYRHVKNAVVYSVLYTRGEGGQNEIGPDLYERLGALRTQETEAAARVLGTQVFYLNFYDFGFSKHAHEAFAEWSRPRRGFWDTDAPIAGEAAGRDTVTARLVHLIRRLKPDVIFTNHDTSTAWPNAQHGQHQVVGVSSFDAFALAADPSYHPEQLREPGVSLWQPSRLFLRRYRRPAHYDVAVPVGDRCGAREETCDALASRAVALHRSQGFDKIADRFRQDTTYFTLLRESPDALPLPPGGSDLAAGLAPNAHATDLALAYLIDSARVPPISESLRVLRTSAPSRTPHVPGDTLDFAIGGATSIQVTGAVDTMVVREPRAGGLPFRVILPPSAVPTLPHYRAQYDRLTSSPPFQFSQVDTTGLPHYADHYLVEIAPPVIVDLSPRPIRLVPGANAVRFELDVADPATDSVIVSLTIEGPSFATTLSQKLGIPAWHYFRRWGVVADFDIPLPSELVPGAYSIFVMASAGPTSAPAEPYVEWRPARVLPDIRVADGLRVGFVRSYDRTTEDALRAMGAEVVVLDSAALAEGRLDGLHTVVLDIRAYLVRADLRAHNDRLLAWVRSGGHLVVGYHKTVDWNPSDEPDPLFGASVVPPDGWAPYPLTLGRSRVTYEDAPVETLAPEHPVFQHPHAITAEDWSGWVQERGLYFPSDYDARYAELVATADPGEEPLRSGLLVAEVGAGTYAYSALAWYRQLEALNPGAWRLFANLVSLPLVR